MAKAMGVRRTFSKPFDPNEMIEAVKDLFNNGDIPD